MEKISEVCYTKLTIKLITEYTKMLDIEKQYFTDHRNELCKKYPGEFVVIKGDIVTGGYDTQDDAMSDAIRLYGLDNYLIRNVNHTVQELNIPALTLGILRANP